MDEIIFYLRYSNLRISLDGGCLGLAEGLKVGDVVVDVLDGEAEDLDAHAADVGGGDLADEGGKLVSVFVHLLDGEGA